MLCERKGAVLKVLPFNDKGELDLSQLDTLLTPRVKLVGVAYVSNVLGTVNPVKELIGRAHRIGAKVLVDGAQAVQHIPMCRRSTVIFLYFQDISYMVLQESECCTVRRIC